jgi:hypothetical protein
MLDKVIPGNAESAGLATADTMASNDELHEATTGLAESLRQAGHAESAHFVEISALVLQDLN